MPTRNGSAQWDGALQDGHGSLTVGNGTFEGPYSFASRFEEGEGTNPEELIAAAHAACFSMALSGVLTKAGHAPQSVRTDARVQLRRVDGAQTLAAIELRTVGSVEGLDAEQFREYAEQAKRDCPISRALAGVGEITIEAQLG